MRTFEVVLIVMNLLSLFLGTKKQTKAIWMGTAGVNLAILVIHGLVEGFRYQMGFSYAFVALLVIYALAKTNDKFLEAKAPTIIKITVIGLSAVALAFTAFLATALPVFTMPKLSGSYAVGITYFHFIDVNRIDPFLDKSPQPRELMVKVYYPAIDDGTKPFSTYFHNSPELVRAFIGGYNMPDFMFDELNLVKTNSKDDLVISDQEQHYPVVLFSHGAGTTMETQTSQSEDLASHGYIVVAIDHTYTSAATVFPDRIVSSREATTDFKVVEPATVITQIMADDSKFVMDKLAELNAGSIDSIFKGKLDLDEIGVIGHSVGGAVAYNLAINDRRVKAAINLDGVVFITPKEDLGEIAPFLMLASDNLHVQAIQRREPLMTRLEAMTAEDREITAAIYGSEAIYSEAYNTAQQNVLGLAEVLKSSRTLYTIEGSDHMKFTDIGLFIGISQLREAINIVGKTDPARVLEITKAVTSAFFDQHLKGETQNSIDALVNLYPELKNVDLN